MKNRKVYRSRRREKRVRASLNAGQIGWTLSRRDPDIQDIISYVVSEHTIYEGVFPDIVRETYLRMDESEFGKYLMTAYQIGFSMGACPWKRYEF